MLILLLELQMVHVMYNTFIRLPELVNDVLQLVCALITINRGWLLFVAFYMEPNFTKKFENLIR